VLRRQTDKLTTVAPSTVMPPLQVFPVATKKAIHSFPNGSAAGPDGLMQQHLKDLLLGGTDDHPLLLIITDMVNLQLEGLVPSSAMIGKKTSSERPIVVGYVWRRLTAKDACCNGRKPVQLFWRQVSWVLGSLEGGGGSSCRSTVQ